MKNCKAIAKSIVFVPLCPSLACSPCEDLGCSVNLGLILNTGPGQGSLFLLFSHSTIALSPPTFVSVIAEPAYPFYPWAIHSLSSDHHPCFLLTVLPHPALGSWHFPWPDYVFHFHPLVVCFSLFNPRPSPLPFFLTMLRDSLLAWTVSLYSSTLIGPAPLAFPSSTSRHCRFGPDGTYLWNVDI